MPKKKHCVPVQAFGGPEKFDPDKIIDPVYDIAYGLNKPEGGLWTSTYIPKEKREQPNVYSEWARWCVDNDFMFDKYQVVVSILYPRKDARVYTIDKVEDLYLASEEVPLAYPDVYYERYLYTTPSLYKKMMVIDFPSLFKEYDGVRVTRKAAARLHMGCTNGHDLYKHLTSLNAWDSESTVWKNGDWVDHVEYEVIEVPKEMRENGFL